MKTRARTPKRLVFVAMMAVFGLLAVACGGEEVAEECRLPPPPGSATTTEVGYPGYHGGAVGSGDAGYSGAGG